MNTTAAIRYPAVIRPVTSTHHEIARASPPRRRTRAATRTSRARGGVGRALALLRGVVVRVVADLLAARDRWPRGGSRRARPAPTAAGQVLWEGLLPRGAWTSAPQFSPGPTVRPPGAGAVAVSASPALAAADDWATAWGGFPWEDAAWADAAWADAAWADPAQAGAARAAPLTWPPQPRRPMPSSRSLPHSCLVRAAHRARGSTGPARPRACPGQLSRPRTHHAGARCLPPGPRRVLR
jgi:hypothetical protein